MAVHPGKDKLLLVFFSDRKKQLALVISIATTQVPEMMLICPAVIPHLTLQLSPELCF